MGSMWWVDEQRPEVLAEVAKRGMALAHVPEEYCSDPDVVLAAISSNPEAARYASKELCLDRHFALEAVERNWRVLPFLPEALQADRAIALAAVRKDRGALELSLAGTFVNFRFTAVVASQEHAVCDGWYRLDAGAGLVNGKPVYVSKKRRRMLVARGKDHWAIIAGTDLAKLDDPDFRGLQEASGGAQPDDCAWSGFAVQCSGALQDDPTLVADLVAGVPAATVVSFYEGESVRLVTPCNEWRTTDSHLRFTKLPPSEVPCKGIARHRLTVKISSTLSFQIVSCIRPSTFRIFPSDKPASNGFFRLVRGDRLQVPAAVGTKEAAYGRSFYIDEQRNTTVSLFLDVAEGFAACLETADRAPGVAVWYEVERSKTAEEFEFTNELPPVVLRHQPEDDCSAEPAALGTNASLRTTSVAGLEIVVDAAARQELEELVSQARELSESCFGEYVTERDWSEAGAHVALLVDTACFAVVGHCLYCVDEGHMHVSQVAVHAALRGRGLGAELLVWAAAEARAAGYGAVRLKSATSAVEFYLRMGFRAVSGAATDAELEELGFSEVPEMELLPPQMEENARKARERAQLHERERAERRARQESKLWCAATARDMLVWVIVGGEDRGGVLVRLGPELASPKAIERLSTGALVQEVRLLEDEAAGLRLHFRRLTGTGPDEGWISVALNHKVLAERLEPEAGRRARERAEQQP